MDAPGPRFSRAREHSYGIVLLLVLASAAFEVAAPEVAWASLTTILFAAVTLLAAVWAAQAQHRFVLLALRLLVAIAVVATVTLIANGSIPAAATAIASGLVVAVAPCVIAAGVVRELGAEHAVTVRTLSGVLAIYLLAGMFFSFLFGAVQAIDGPFFAQVDDPSRSDFLYFSYVTVATVGYGDLTAASDLGRMLAVTEGLLGQIYLVTVVALIVSNLGRGAPAGRRGRPAPGDS
jgi:hypothetical protein